MDVKTDLIPSSFYCLLTNETVNCSKLKFL